MISSHSCIILVKFAQKLATCSTLAFSQIGIADTNGFTIYSNERYHTTFQYPGDWPEMKAQLSGDRQVTSYVDPANSETSVSVTYTPIAADFNSLNSLGGKESIRQYLLPKGEGVEAAVVEEKVKGDNYYLEYIIKAPQIQPKHVQSIFALRPQESVVMIDYPNPGRSL